LRSNIASCKDDLVGIIYGNDGNGSDKQEESYIKTSKSNKENEGKQNNKEAQTRFSVADALRLNSGYVKVHGMITSLSQLYKMITAEKFVCENCGNASIIEYDVPTLHLSDTKNPKKCLNCKMGTLRNVCEYINAVTIELQDIDTFSEIERLSVLLFDDNTKNIHVGERVTIRGQIHIVQHKGKGCYKQMVFYK
jgi:DNA replicative helicase MCM subunit Mcm2 (Cdc46/Mcm family)